MENLMFKQEKERLRLLNLEQNLNREKTKDLLKKYSVIEKDFRAAENLRNKTLLEKQKQEA